MLEVCTPKQSPCGFCCSVRVHLILVVRAITHFFVDTNERQSFDIQKSHISRIYAGISDGKHMRMQKKALSVSLSVSVLCMSLLAANSAFASKARVNALQGALGLVDSQTIFAQPAYINKLDPHATFEFGQTGAGAEGGFLLNNGARMGAYLGHQSAVQNFYRGTTFMKQNNPIDLFYGNGDWGASVSLSNSEDLTTDQKETSLIGRFGYLMGTQEIAVSVDLLGSAEKKTGANTDKFTTTIPTIAVSWLNTMDNMVVAAGISYGGGDNEVAGTKTEMKSTGLQAGVNLRPFDGFYYGAFITYSDLDVGGKKKTAYGVPVVFGLEKDMTSWLTARGSIKQNFLLSSSKDEGATPPADKEKKNMNDTVVAAGLGAKFSNFTIDGIFEGSTTGKVNGNAFLGQASLTYTF